MSPASKAPPLGDPNAMAPIMTASYQRPVKATLIVRLENGEEWEATPDDLEAFDAGRRRDIYARAERLLTEALGYDDDLTNYEGPNLVRYLMECAIVYDHSPWADANGEPWPKDDDAAGFKDQIRKVILEEVPEDS